MKSYIRRISSMLNDHGFAVVSIRSKNHLVFKTKHETGSSCSFVCGCTPSDHRATSNFKALISRVADAQNAVS